MTTDAMEVLLQEHPFVEEFLPQHIEKLATLAMDASFDKNQIIFREGDECGLFYLIVSGTVVLELHAPGRVIRIQTLGAGDELGWSSMLMHGKHFQARALEHVRAVAFEGASLYRACKEDTTLGFALMYRFLGVVSRRLQATRLQMLDVYSSKAKESPREITR